MQDGQSVRLNPPKPAELVVCLYWRAEDVFIHRNFLGKVVRVITDEHVAVKFDDFKYELVVPTKYLEALS